MSPTASSRQSGAPPGRTADVRALEWMLMGTTHIDRREVDRAPKIAVVNGRLDRDGEQRAIE